MMPTHDDLYVILSAADILAFFLALGALACRLWVAPANARYLDTPLWRLAGTGILALAASSVALFIGRTMEMSGESFKQSVALLPAMVTDTQFGHIWLARPVALLLLAALWWRGRSVAHTRASAAVMLILVSIMAFTRSATGHPADTGPFTLPEWVDWIHLLAAALWVGTLLAVVLTVLPAIFRTRPPSGSVLALVERLSRLAGFALLAVLSTGLVSAWHYLVDLHNLTATAYGRVLLIKLAFVAGAIALGALNRYVALPRLRRSTAATGSGSRILLLLARSLRLEVIALLGALAGAAVLLHTMPPVDRPPRAFGHPASVIMTTHGSSGHTMAVSFRAAPTRKSATRT